MPQGGNLADARQGDQGGGEGAQAADEGWKNLP
jgi:hypothetical protein